MVVYAFLKTCFGLVNLIVALLPQGDPPSFISDVTPTLHSAVAGAAGMSGWIPWPVAIATASAVFAIWVVLVVISGVRWLVGWIPTMGGA